MECEDIGPLVKIRIGHDNNGMRSAWFLEKVTFKINSLFFVNLLTKVFFFRGVSVRFSVPVSPKVEIRRVKPEDKEPRKNRGKSGDVEEMADGDEYNYLFVCNRWLARDEDDGQIVRELVPVDSSGKPRRGSLAGRPNEPMQTCSNFM